MGEQENLTAETRNARRRKGVREKRSHQPGSAAVPSDESKSRIFLGVLGVSAVQTLSGSVARSLVPSTHVPFTVPRRPFIRESQQLVKNQ